MAASRFVKINDFQRRFVRAGMDLLGKVARALTIEAELIKARSVEDCPVDSGALRGSHRVSKPVLSGVGNDVSVAIRVGGPSPGYMPVHYAIYVHEMLGLHHPVGKAKFLEDAVHAAAPEFGARIAKRIAEDV